MLKGLGIRYRRGLAFIVAVFMVLVNVLADVGTAYAFDFQENIIRYKLNPEAVRNAVDAAKRSELSKFNYENLDIMDDDGSCDILLDGSDIYELSGRLAITGQDNTGMRVFYDSESDQVVALFINKNKDERYFIVEIGDDESEPVCVSGTAEYNDGEPTPEASPANASDDGIMLTSALEVATGGNADEMPGPGTPNETVTQVGGATVLTISEEKRTSGNLADFLTGITVLEIRDDGSEEEVKGMMTRGGHYKVTLNFNDETSPYYMRAATPEELSDAGIILSSEDSARQWMYVILGDIKADMVQDSVGDNGQVKIVNGGEAILFAYKQDMRNAFITFTGTLKEDANLQQVQIVVGSDTGIFTPEPDDAIKVRKTAASYDPENHRITYRVTVSNPPAGDIIQSLLIEDKIETAGARFVEGSFKVGEKPVDAVIDEDEQSFALSLSEVGLQPGEEIVLSYDIDVSSLVEEYASSGSQESFNVKNQVSVTPNGEVSGKGTPVTDNEDYKVYLGYLTKEGEVCYDCGEKNPNCIRWDIRLYDPYQRLDGTVVTDEIPEGLTIYKVKFYSKDGSEDSKSFKDSYYFGTDKWNSSSLFEYDEATRRLTITIPDTISSNGREENDKDFNHIVKISIHTTYEAGAEGNYKNTVTAKLPSEGDVERTAEDGVPVGNVGVDTDKTGALSEDGRKLDYTITVTVGANLAEKDAYFGAGAAILDRMQVPDDTRVDTSAGMTIKSFTAEVDGVTHNILKDNDIKYGIYAVYPYPDSGSSEHVTDKNGCLIKFDNPAENMYGWTAVVINPIEDSTNSTVKGEWPEDWKGKQVTLHLEYSIDPDQCYLKGDHGSGDNNYKGWRIHTYTRGQTLRDFLKEHEDTVISNKAYGIVNGHGDDSHEKLNVVNPLNKDGEVSIDPNTSQRKAVYSVTFNNGVSNDGAVPQGAQNVVFKDQFDSRMELVTGSLKVTRTYPDGGSEKVFTYQDANPVEGNTITASFANFIAEDGENLQDDFNHQGTHCQYCFTYELLAGKDFSQKDNDKFVAKQTITNEAWFEWDGGRLESVRELLEFPTGVLTKAATLENGNVVFYVEINEAAADLSEDKLTVVDKPSNSVGLKFDEKVTVDKYENGGWSNLDETLYEKTVNDDGTFSLTLPDETHLRIRYEYTLADDYAGAEVSITNKVSVSGLQTISDGDKWVFQTSAIESGASGSYTNLTLNKVDASNNGKLSGAEFILYAYKLGNASTENKAAEEAEKFGIQTVGITVDGISKVLRPAEVLTTGENGQAKVTWPYLSEDEVYALAEVVAPEGYQKLDDPIVFNVEKGTEIVKILSGLVNGSAQIGVSKNEMTVPNTPIEPVGSLKITKTVEGGGTEAAEKIYTFEVTGPNGYSHEVTVTGSSSETLEGLAPGEYTVAEKDANIEGYTLDVTGGGKVTVESEKTAETTVTNTYTQKLGSLKITKTVEGGGTEAAEKIYTFEVTGPNGYSHEVTVTGSSSETLEGLAPGEYTVVEKDANIEGYTLDVTGGGEVTVEAEKTAETTVTNTYTQKIGSLKITKTVEGGGTEAAGKTYTFDVTGPNGYSHEVTVTGSGSETLENLVPGEYTVAEQNADIVGYTLDVPGGGEVTVEAEKTAEATVTNTYTPQLGSLTITKAIDGGANEAERKTYTFTVTGPENYSETVTITGNGSKTLNDLKPGTYTVMEQNSEIEGYKLVVTGEGDVAVEAGKDAVKTVTNTYTPNESTKPSAEETESSSEETNPTEPTNPTSPTEPTNPTEPTQPMNPTNPTESTQPTSPTQPTQPGNTPGGNTPGGNTPGGNTPGGTTPPGNTTPTLSLTEGIPENPTPLAEMPFIENISDEPTPLSGLQLLENIEDEDVPLAFLAPMTGDDTPTVAAALFGLIALGMMGVFGILSFKKEDDES